VPVNSTQRKGLEDMKTLKKLSVLAAAVSAAFVLTAQAGAGTIPAYTVANDQYCFKFGSVGEMSPFVSIKGADLYLVKGESQRVYAQSGLFRASGSGWALVAGSGWMYGQALDFVSPASWLRLSDNTYLGNSTTLNSLLGYSNLSGGTYRIAVQFAWDRSSTGAPSGMSPLMWAGNSCTF
jgi:hypothetical protein